MADDDVHAAVSVLSAALDTLLDVDLEQLSAAEFSGVLEAIEVERRRLDALDTRLLAAADDQHVAAQFCRSSIADLLVHQLRLSPGEARARVRRARDLGSRRTLLGERLEPIHPILAAAQRAGEVSTQQIDVATKALGRLPVAIAWEATATCEQFLTDAARHEGPSALARSATALLQRLDPDGAEPNDERNHTNRAFGLRRRADGTWSPYGSLTDETGLIWKTILDAVSAPAPAESGERDPRSPDQRGHDGLRDLGIRLLRSGQLPDSGACPVTVVLRTTTADLADPNGLCQSEHGHVLRLKSLTHLAADSEVIPWCFDRPVSDRQLVLGRSRRLANRAQRRALVGRDGGCSFPGCDRPASWCEAHHIVEWADGGSSDIDNLCLVCPFHHREFGRRGWSVTMTAGRPHWVPPRWLDPDRRPRLNTAHHLPEIAFDPNGTIVGLRR